MPNAYTTVDAVLIATCLKLGDNALRKYAQLNAHATSWFHAEYSPESGQTLKTVLLDVGPDRVAELPDDFLDFVVVGRQVGDRIRNLAHNPQLSPLPVFDAGVARPSLSMQPVLTGEFPWPSYEYAGWDGGELCGYGWGEYREEFTIDTRERTLRLSSLLGADEPLFLQYVSADLSPHKATPLHPAYGQALYYYVLAEHHHVKENFTAARENEKKYNAALRKAKRQLSPFSLASLKAIVAASYNTIR